VTRTPRARVVLEAGGHAPGSGLHSGIQELLHPLHLLRRGERIRAIGLGLAHHLQPKLSVRDQVDDVAAEGHLVDAVQPAANRLGVREAASAIAGGDGADALEEEVQIGVHRFGKGHPACGAIQLVGVIVEIDEAGCDHQACCVDLAPRAPGHLAHRRDPVAQNRQVSRALRRLSTPVESPSAQHQIVAGLRERGTRPENEEKESSQAEQPWCGSQDQPYDLRAGSAGHADRVAP